MLEALEAEGVRYVVIGGTAAVMRGASHLTFDLDITPARDLPNLDRVAAALRRLNGQVFGLPPEAADRFQLDGRTLANGSAWKFLTDHGELDLALDPDGTSGYRDLVRKATPVRLGDLTVQVAALEDVIRSKEAADRPRDRAVLDDLRRTLELQRQRERRADEPS
jgi:hypothetical protein